MPRRGRSTVAGSTRVADLKRSATLLSACVAAAASWSLGQPPTTAFHSNRLPHPERSIRVGFWFGMSNNEVLTPEVVEWICDRASIVILNGTEKGIDPYFDYANVVDRFHDCMPQLPVLLYDWLQHDYKTGDGGRVGGLSYGTLSARPAWQVAGADGQPLRSRALLMDVTNAEYRKYLVEHVVENIRRLGANGVAFDTTLASLERPGGPTAASRYAGGAALAGVWTEATQTLLAEVKQALGRGKLVLFNGLFHNTWPGRLQAQAELLPFVDAAAVEFFGRNVHVPEGKRNEVADFDELVWDYAKLLPKHPDKIIPVFGRSPRYVYLDYEEDYQIQRYCLVGYLLAMTPLSTFKYHSHFQTEYRPPGRTYGLSYYADWDLALGAPVGEAFEEDGLYLRRFERALACIAPMHREGGHVQLNGSYFTPEGQARTGRVRVEPGAAMVFLREKPPPLPSRLVLDDFEHGDPGMWQQPARPLFVEEDLFDDGRFAFHHGEPYDAGVEVLAEGTGHFLRIRTSEKALLPYHERRVQPIRSLTRYGRLRFRIRTSDVSSAVLIRVEVTDSSPPATVWPEDTVAVRRPPFKEEKRTPYCVLVAHPLEGTFTFAPVDADIPYGQMRAGKAPYYLCPGATYEANGQWHSVAVNLAEVLARAAPHLTPHRVPEIRLIGEADLDDLALQR